MGLYFVQKLQPTQEAVRNAAKKAIMCEESNTGKHSSPNIITGAGNFPPYFVLKPSLGLPASMGSSEPQWVLHQPRACLLQLGFANEGSNTHFQPSLPISPLIILQCITRAVEAHQFLLHFPLLYILPCPFTLMLYQSNHSQKLSCVLGFLPFWHSPS